VVRVEYFTTTISHERSSSEGWSVRKRTANEPRRSDATATVSIDRMGLGFDTELCREATRERSSWSCRGRAGGGFCGMCSVPMSKPARAARCAGSRVPKQGCDLPARTSRTSRTGCETHARRSLPRSTVSPQVPHDGSRSRWGRKGALRPTGCGRDDAMLNFLPWNALDTGPGRSPRLGHGTSDSTRR
jgi:hypothetical protein